MANTEESFKKLDSWLQKNGWRGYDPYDIKGNRTFLALNKNKCSAVPLNFFTDCAPQITRRLFRIKKEINPKGMALFSRGYLNLYKKTGDKSFLDKSTYCLNWLLENACKQYSGLSWGYPFDWQTKIFIPKNTPSGVVTSAAAHAFLDAYETLNERKYLDAANSCCAFIQNHLKKEETKGGEICFSYTPLDRFQIHNANLLCASALLRTYSNDRKEEYMLAAKSAIKFTVSHQNPDGSWYYWAPLDENNHVIDNYHTGFVLESLNTCGRVLGEEFTFAAELRKGFEFYKNNLFLDEAVPKYTSKNTHPVDIHGCAQAIITFSELSGLEETNKRQAEKIAAWTIKNMQDKKGFFYYRKYKNRKDRTPYIRWGQAWMLRALSYLWVK